MCCLYLCVVISTVKSATYYYRAGREGREIIVPLVDEAQQQVQPLIAELKKDPLVVVDEVVVAPAENAPAVIAAVIEEKLPEPFVRVAAEEPIRENGVVKVSEVVAEEARRSPPTVVEKLESLEIVPAAGSPLKSATISETVKEAAIEAIRTTNAEIVKEAEPVVAPVVAPVESAPIVEAVIVPEVKSPSVVVPEIKSVESIPVNEIVVPVEKVAENVAEAVVVESEPAAKEAPKEEEVDPNVRQSAVPAPPQSANPLGQLAQQIIQPLQQGFNTFIQNAQNALNPNRPAQVADAPADAVVEAVTSIAPTSPSGPAAFLQQFQNTISNILRPQATAATVPAAPITNEIKGGDEPSPDVNDKVDLSKAAEKIE